MLCPQCLLHGSSYGLELRRHRGEPGHKRFTNKVTRSHTMVCHGRERTTVKRSRGTKCQMINSSTKKQKHQTLNRKDQHLNPGRARNLPTVCTGRAGDNVMKVSNLCNVILALTGTRLGWRSHRHNPEAGRAASPFAGFGASSKQGSRYSCGNEQYLPPPNHSRGTHVDPSCNRAFDSGFG